MSYEHLFLVMLFRDGGLEVGGRGGAQVTSESTVEARVSAEGEPGCAG